MLFSNYYVLYKLILNDLKKQYLGSVLGFIWAFVQPLINIIVIWFVFQVGFRATDIGNVPYILWLISGLIPWYFLSDAISKGTNVIVEYEFLVKKIIFNIDYLPIVKIFSSFLIHSFFLIFLFFCFFFYYDSFTIYWFQIPFIILLSIFLLIGIIYITSSINVFFRDMGQIVNMILQILFWATPILWDINKVDIKYQFLLKLNPFFYIIEGFRYSLIYKKWIWEDSMFVFYFIPLVVMIFIVGRKFFKQLSSHFADVL